MSMKRNTTNTMSKGIDEETYLLQPNLERTGIIPIRYIFAAMSCLGMVNVYAMRVNLSVAMVAMVNSSALPVTENVTSECNYTDHADTSDGEFVWDQKTQSMILGSFFYGYVVTQLPGGRLAELYSAKWIFGLGVLCTSVFSLLTPLAAQAGPAYLVAVRVIEGLGEGVTFPTMNAMIPRWCPEHERSRFVTGIFTGTLLGTVIGIPASSYLCLHGFAGGWPSVFYVFGTIGIVWFIFWALLAYDSPLKHPWISEEEKLYICRGSAYTNSELKKPAVPWRKVATSLPLWSIIISHFGHNWGFYLLLTQLPTYLKTILGFDMKSNGWFSALPYLTCWLFSFMNSFICDKVMEKNYFSITVVRKTSNLMGLLVPGVLLIGLTFVGCDTTITYSILVVGMTINGAVNSGFLCNHIEIAPNFGGTLFGITNTIGTIPGWMGPWTVGDLTQGQPYRKQWNIVFYITAAIYIFSAVFSLIFSQHKVQSWNKIDNNEPEPGCSQNINEDPRDQEKL